MAKYAVLKALYASERWTSLRMLLIAERGPICQQCGRVIPRASMITAHHRIELTPENVGDPAISLNPDNIELVCFGCHQKAHQRFGHEPVKGVWVVYGPPLAGKSTFVRDQKGRHDLVVDIDRLFAAVTMLPEYDKPDILLSNVRGIYNLLVDNIKTRYGRWHSAWVITGGADRYRRERLAEDLGAELVFCDVSREECLRRLELDEARRCRQDEWRGYIERWFREYAA